MSARQVTIEVVDDPQAEMEMDLLKETSNDWSLTFSEWLSHKDLFWPLFWEYTDPAEGDEEEEDEEEEEEEEEDDNLEVGDREEEEEDDDEEEDYTAEYEEEESMLSGVEGNWDQRWPGQKNWIFKEKYNYGEFSWHVQLPCRPALPSPVLPGPQPCTSDHSTLVLSSYLQNKPACQGARPALSWSCQQSDMPVSWRELPLHVITLEHGL